MHKIVATFYCSWLAFSTFMFQARFEAVTVEWSNYFRHTQQFLSNAKNTLMSPNTAQLSQNSFFFALAWWLLHFVHTRTCQKTICKNVLPRHAKIQKSEPSKVSVIFLLTKKTKQWKVTLSAIKFLIHWSPLVRSTFWPKKVGCTSSWPCFWVMTKYHVSHPLVLLDSVMFPFGSCELLLGSR